MHKALSVKALIFLIVTSLLIVGAAQYGLAAKVQADAPCTGTAKQCASDGAGLTGSSSSSGTALNSLISNVVNILSIIVGAISIIMIIIGGLRYVMSGGDSNSTSSAKSTIVYALVGLVIAILAQVLVQFVLTNTNSALQSGKTSALPHLEPYEAVWYK